MVAATRLGRPLPDGGTIDVAAAASPYDSRSEVLLDVLEERLEPLGVPVLYGLPLGHAKHLAALPRGVTCTPDADARTLTVDEPALR